MGSLDEGWTRETPRDGPGSAYRYKNIPKYTVNHMLVPQLFHSIMLPPPSEEGVSHTNMRTRAHTHTHTPLT